MSLRIRRGTEAQRTGLSTIDEGELLWVTNTQKMYVGLGNNQAGDAGMINIGKRMAGDGLAWDDTTQTLKFGGINYTTDDVAEGVMVGRRYFTDERAQDAVAAALVAGQGNVNFVYNTTQDGANRIDATVTLDGGLLDVVADTSPQLGGNLDLNSHNITGTGDINITGNVTGTTVTGTTLASGLSSITNNTLLTTNAPPFPPIPYLDSNNVFGFGSTTNPQTLWQYATTTFNVQTGIIGTVDGTVSTQTRMSRGTLAIPEAVVAEDRLLKMVAMGYDGAGWATAGAFGLQVDDESPVAEGFVPGRFGVITVGSEGLQQMTFNSLGTLEAPILQTGNYTTSPDTRPGVARKGMIIFETTTNTFQGWNGTSWVTLG